MSNSELKQRDLNAFLEFLEAADVFNDISGQSTKVTFADISRQADLISEEGHFEMNEALDSSDLVGVLDATADTLFVTLGMLQKLRNKGLDVSRALAQVAFDNLSKYPTDINTVLETVKMYEDNGIQVTSSYYEDNKVYVIKNTNDKVMKPFGFVGTDLTKYVPVDLINEFKKGK